MALLSFTLRSMEVYESWHWVTSSTILGLVSLQFYWANPQGHKMAAADSAKQDKDYVHHQAIPHLPTIGNHCSSIYYYRLICLFWNTYKWNHTACTLLYLESLTFFEIHSCYSNC